MCQWIVASVGGSTTPLSLLRTNDNGFNAFPRERRPRFVRFFRNEAGRATGTVKNRRRWQIRSRGENDPRIHNPPCLEPLPPFNMHSSFPRRSRGKLDGTLNVPSLVPTYPFEIRSPIGRPRLELSRKKRKTRARASSVRSSVSFVVRAMIAHRGGDSSLVFRLLFFPLILVASGHEFARNGTVIPDNDHYVNPSNVSSSVTSHGTEMEARSDGELSVTRSVERKSGGPFSYRRDSYLEALRHSRTSTDPREGIVDVVGSGSFHRRKEQSLGPVYTTKRSEIPVSSSSRIVHVDRDSFSMVPSDSYSLPTRTSADFNGVKNTYGPPQSSYGSPSYGPPPSNDYSYGTSGGGYSPYQPQQGETRGIVLGSFETERIFLRFLSIVFWTMYRKRSSLRGATRDIRLGATLPSVHRFLLAVRAQAERLHPGQDTSQAGDI